MTRRTKPEQVINYYGLLGVPQNATKQEILQAWRIVAAPHHPDKAANLIGAQAAHENFLRYRDARETLCQGRHTREAYDQDLALFERRQRNAASSGRKRPSTHTRRAYADHVLVHSPVVPFATWCERCHKNDAVSPEAWQQSEDAELRRKRNLVPNWDELADSDELWRMLGYCEYVAGTDSASGFGDAEYWLYWQQVVHGCVPSRRKPLDPEDVPILRQIWDSVRLLERLERLHQATFRQMLSDFEHAMRLSLDKARPIMAQIVKEFQERSAISSEAFRKMDVLAKLLHHPIDGSFKTMPVCRMDLSQVSNLLWEICHICIPIGNEDFREELERMRVWSLFVAASEEREQQEQEEKEIDEIHFCAIDPDPLPQTPRQGETIESCAPLAEPSEFDKKYALQDEEWSFIQELDDTPAMNLPSAEAQHQHIELKPRRVPPPIKVMPKSEFEEAARKYERGKEVPRRAGMSGIGRTPRDPRKGKQVSGRAGKAKYRPNLYNLRHWSQSDVKDDT